MGGSHTDWSSSLCVRFGFYFFFHGRPLQISAVGWRATALTSVLFVWSFGCGFGGAFGWACGSSRGALQDEMSAFMGGLVTLRVFAAPQLAFCSYPSPNNKS